VDSVYAGQISADNSLLFTANRGLNTITVYDYPQNTCGCRSGCPSSRSSTTACGGGAIRDWASTTARCSALDPLGLSPQP
jgi:hypothetical protein